MYSLDSLKLEEQRLGKVYTEWTDLEKINFVIKTNIGNFGDDIQNIINRINQEVANMKNINGDHPKVEKYVSLSELIDFTYRNCHDIWNSFISYVKREHSMFFDEFFKYNLSNIKMNVRENRFLEFELKYYYHGSIHDFYRYISFMVGKKNNRYYITNCDLILDAQKKFLDNVDFAKLYNYFVVNKNDYIANLDIIYNHDDIVEKLPIKMAHNYVCLGSKYGNENIDNCDCGIIYYFDILANKMKHKEVLTDDNPLTEKISYCCATDSNYLDHLLVNYNDLPLYIQEKLYKYKAKNNQKTDEKTNFLKRIFNRK